MTINREHLAGLELARKELGEHGPELKAHVDYHLLPLIAQAQAAPEAEPVAIHQWCIDGVWMDAGEDEAADARCLGYQTRIVYTAPQHDAELVELLRDVSMRGALMGWEPGLIGRIDAKLSTLSAKNEGGKA